MVGFLWLYFALGLIAVSIARISEKASEAQSAGKALPMRRFAQLLLAAGVTIGAAWLLSTVFTPAGIRRFFHLFDPVWRLVSPLAFALLMVIGQALNPLLLWFEAFILRLLRNSNLSGFEIAPVAPAATEPSFLAKIPAWIPNLLVDALVVVGIIVAVLALTGFLVLYLERVRKSGLRDEDEEEGAERVTAGGILERGTRALRNAAGLIRRFGLGTHLLAAISVQNIYANVSRLARDRGYPRRPAQPPDDYLPVLVGALGGFEDQLARITAAYMRVHYGDHPVSRAELTQLREDYRAVREGEAGTGGRGDTETRVTSDRETVAPPSTLTAPRTSGGSWMDRIFFALGALSGAMAVALGAFGAHGLKTRLPADLLATFETGVRYQMYHALALLAVAWAVTRWAGSSLPAAAGWLFVAGTVLFSFSLYLLALTGQRWLGAITPLGGVAFVAGWVCLALAAWRR